MCYHAKDLRRCRFSESGRPYLITTVTHGRKPVYCNFDVARLLIDELRTTCDKLLIESLAWVVMPDHLHWMFVFNRSTVAEVVSYVKGTSAHSINICRGYSGRVWQKGFDDHALRQDEDIKAVARYIIANPLRAGLVDNRGLPLLGCGVVMTLSEQFAAEVAKSFSHCYDQFLLIYSRIFMINKSISWH